MFLSNTFLSSYWKSHLWWGWDDMLHSLLATKNISSIKNNGFSHQMVVSNPWWYPQISRHDWLLVFFNNHGWPKPRTPAAIDPRHRASWDFWSPPTGLYVHPLGSSRAFPRRRYQLYLKQGEYLPVELRCHQMWCALKKKHCRWLVPLKPVYSEFPSVYTSMDWFLEEI